MSLDVLPFVPGKAMAVREVARILRPGGRFAFTTWEQLTHPRAALTTPPYPQGRHRRALGGDMPISISPQ
jgi:SAM-dependent methyltransferase